ncbi:hypothetical protein [Streptomyces deccanensis]|uniref:hypothetical protein n=1 Tax=Streptomyces deccanensis TaxID=424188 RepID=UPI001EFA836E|nr:hypothetical protein [Streptomyces deccanensis]ULR51500.1 hypothetical protein L3078_20555 [Streptomyces deccanensis]
MRKSGARASAVVAACATVLLCTGAAHAGTNDLPWTRAGLAALTISPTEGSGAAEDDLPWTR